MQWKYDAAPATGDHYDSVRIERYNTQEEITFLDYFTQDTPTGASNFVSCGGINKQAEYCWAIDLRIKGQSGLFKWGESFSVDYSDLTFSRMVMKLVNYDSALGAITNAHSLVGTLSDFSLTTVDDVTPVPLPGAVWLFLSGLSAYGVTAGRRFRRQAKA